jgi:hypothetical protein
MKTILISANPDFFDQYLAMMEMIYDSEVPDVFERFTIPNGYLPDSQNNCLEIFNQLKQQFSNLEESQITILGKDKQDYELLTQVLKQTSPKTKVAHLTVPDQD